MHRPYSTKSTKELETLATDATTVEECDLLEHELGFRGRDAARRVEDFVRTRRVGIISMPQARPAESGRSDRARPTGTRGSTSVPNTATTLTTSTETVAQPPLPEPVGGTRPVVPDEHQLAVAEAEPDTFQIVDAPPGTGKTFTACRRIVWLVQNGVPAHQIWMISFTRAAIAELRIRIRQLAMHGHAVDGLVASTLDSRAWHLVNGFTTRGGEALGGGHERSINEAIRLLENPPDALAEWLSTIRHLVVDEAQDLVGSRTRLLHAILAALPQSCGVTIMGDRAQAIYGFADNGSGDTSEPFMRQCAKRYSEKVVTKALARVFRTDNSGLQRLFEETRSDLLEAINSDGERAYRWLRDLLITGFPATDFEDPDRFDLQLHRRRYAALDEAMWAVSKGEPVRLRLSGFPRAIHPWLAMVFGECAHTMLYRSDFESMFADASTRWPSALWPSVDIAWSCLRLVAPASGGALSLHKLRVSLASGDVPDALLLPEYGFEGPIYSTIHASKGREAGQVDVELPPNYGAGETNWDEEARVLFVAATRASRSLVVKDGKRLYISRASDGRDVRKVPGTNFKYQIEVGCEGDLDLPSLLLGSFSNVVESQLVLAAHHGRAKKLRARRPEQGEGDERCYRLFEEQRASEPVTGRNLGLLSTHFYWTLKDTATQLWPTVPGYPPTYIQHLHSLGARTIVFAPGDSAYDAAAEPYASSGFFLAPMLAGLPTVPFFNRTSNRQ